MPGCVVSICCVGFTTLDVVCDELNDCPWNVCLYQLSNECMYVYCVKMLLISSATVIVRVGGAIWLNPFATVLFSVCSAVTVESPCCMGVFAVMWGRRLFSSVFAITERRDMGLYDVPLSVSLLVLGYGLC